MPATTKPSKRRLSSSGSMRKLMRMQGGSPTARSVTAGPCDAQYDLLSVVHQFSLCSSTYDPKPQRLEQILDRLPANGGPTAIFAKRSSLPHVSSAVERARRKAARSRGSETDVTTSEQAGLASTGTWTCGGCTFVNDNRVTECQACHMIRGRFPSVTVAEADGETIKLTRPQEYSVVINFDFPSSGHEYTQRLSYLQSAKDSGLRVAYTLVEEEELQQRQCLEVVKLLKFARQVASAAKRSELDASLKLLLQDDDGEDEEDDAGSDDDDECTCLHCRGNALASMSHHPLLPFRRDAFSTTSSTCSGVEVVRLKLSAVADLDTVAPFIAPRSTSHTCTIICLHCLFVHTPWDGFEQLFAPLELSGSIRVVLVLAEGGSWHEYHDSALLEAGGSPWMDILDMNSMNQSDELLEHLVDHEIALLDGKSERIVLMGMSQGGGQSMLRFLRSHRRLGGWVGSVCHVPTAPHAPRTCDPLLAAGRPLVNCDRPIRLLAGESDYVFPPGLVLRDAARLRDVGGFTDVEVDVRPGLEHDGMAEEAIPSCPPCRGSEKKAETPTKSPSGKGPSAILAKGPKDKVRRHEKMLRQAESCAPELLFLQRHLPSLVGLSPNIVPDLC